MGHLTSTWPSRAICSWSYCSNFVYKTLVATKHGERAWGPYMQRASARVTPGHDGHSSTLCNSLFSLSHDFLILADLINPCEAPERWSSREFHLSWILRSRLHVLCLLKCWSSFKVILPSTEAIALSVRSWFFCMACSSRRHSIVVIIGSCMESLPRRSDMNVCRTQLLATAIWQQIASR